MEEFGKAEDAHESLKKKQTATALQSKALQAQGCNGSDSGASGGGGRGVAALSMSFEISKEVIDMK